MLTLTEKGQPLKPYTLAKKVGAPKRLGDKLRRVLDEAAAALQAEEENCTDEDIRQRAMLVISDRIEWGCVSPADRLEYEAACLVKERIEAKLDRVRTAFMVFQTAVAIGGPKRFNRRFDQEFRKTRSKGTVFSE
jgi:hypothetical protein